MSKLTNLKKGVVGVCAAAMLTGLCAVPAFAAEATNETPTQGGGLGTDGVAQSQVSLSAADVTAQISATVPTTLPVAVSDSGFTPPTGAAITNTSPNYGIVVKSVGVTKDNSNLTLVDHTKASLAANEMWMTVAVGNDTTNVIDLGAATVADPLPTIWKMDTGSSKTINLTIDGGMGALNGDLLKGVLGGGTGSNLFKISWTIAADI